MARVRLNQVIANESSVKTHVESDKTKLYQLVQKPDPFNGLHRKFRPFSENPNDQLPTESKLVEARIPDVISKVTARLIELWDATATKEYGNVTAKADVVVDGRTVLAGAPVPLLIFLEKQLIDLYTFVGSLQVLSTTESWTFDESSGFYKSEPTDTQRTKKSNVPLILSPATEKHPAQVQLVTEDIPVGVWSATKMSGAIPPSRREELLRRVEKLQKAVKAAREEANTTMVDQQTVAAPIFDFLFGP